MQWKVSMIVLTGLSALCVTGCSVQREALRTSTDLRTTESRIDTVREQVMIAVYDTLREVTTITVQQNEAGDTVKTSIVTERDRFRDRAAVKDREEKVIVRTDTVFVQKTDSVYVQKALGANPTENHRSPWLSALKWIFAIVVAVTVLIVVIKVGKVFRV